MRQRYYKKCPLCPGEVLYPTKHLIHRHQLKRSCDSWNNTLQDFTRTSRFVTTLSKHEQCFLNIQDERKLNKYQKRAVKIIFDKILKRRFRLNATDWTKLAPFSASIREYSPCRDVLTLTKHIILKRTAGGG